MPAINPARIAAVMPPAVAFKPPVSAPIKPSSWTACFTPLAMLYPNPVSGTVAPESHTDHHKADQNPGGGQFRLIDQHLADHTKKTPYQKCFNIVHLQPSCDGYCMANTGDRQSLLGGGGGEQRSRAAEQNAPVFAVLHFG